VEWTGAAATVAAQKQESRATFRQGVGLVTACCCLEDDHLEIGNQASAAITICRPAGSAAHRDHERAEPYPEEWLLMEWPKGESEPTKYWLSTLPASTKARELVRMAKHRWIIERDYEELKQELGLGQYEGRGGCAT
jgi:hypothetical protein